MGALPAIRSLTQRVRRRTRSTTAGERFHVPAYLPTPDQQPDVKSVLDEDERSIIGSVRGLTMVSDERLVAVIDAMKYVVDCGIPGAVAECGVWRGGSVLAMIRTLQLRAVCDRDLYLFDTFSGMTEPGQEDTSPFEPPALETWTEARDGTVPWSWAFDPAVYGIEQVRQVMEASGYPMDRIHLVPGPVEDTIPGNAPDSLALVRLDTDWYESTRHELEHLYARLSVGGVLIIDDYGHWDGARKAVDEFFSNMDLAPLLNRIDYTGRIAVKR